MVFSNIDIDPRDTFKLAETEASLWLEAQTSHAQRITQTRDMVSSSLPPIPDMWCFMDGS